MKYFLSLFLTICSITVYSQWSIMPLDVEDTYRMDDVFFLDSLNGFGCTGGGSIFKVTDGQMAVQVLSEDVYFRSIEFINENIGFAGTLENALYKTTDGGDTWNVTETGFDIPGICGMQALNDSTLLASGAWFEPAYIIKTVDAGNTWTFTDMSAFATALVDIHFIDENIGFVTGNNDEGAIILKTVDGGNTWEEVFNNGVPGFSWVWKIDHLFDNENFIYASIQSTGANLVISNDQGVTWTEFTSPSVENQGIGFVSETHGWAGGYGQVFETFDGGETWSGEEVLFGINRMFILDESHVFVGGIGMYKLGDVNTGVSITANNTFLANTTVYPNPIKDKLNYSITLGRTDNLRLFLLDPKGQLVADLKYDRLEPGVHEYTFDLDFVNGSYVVVSQLNGSYKFDKIIIAK